MELYNCHTKEEKELQEIQLQGLSNGELMKLSASIKYQFNEAILQDEIIVVDAIHQINMELWERLGRD